MIFIVVKHPVRPEYVDRWADLMQEFTAATRAEPGSISFEWARSLDNPKEFVLIEAFADADAGAAHVNTEHFQTAVAGMPDLLSAPPRIVHADIPATGWSTMSEVTVGNP